MAGARAWARRRARGRKQDDEKQAKLRARKEAAAAKKAAKRARKEMLADAAEDAMLAAAMGGGVADGVVSSGGGASGADLLSAIKSIQSRKAAELTGTVVTELSTESPTPRCYTNVVTPDGDIAIFGGEWWDGRHTTMYGDMLLFSPKTSTWRVIDAPVSPPPRSSHQVVAVRESLFVFGGEFSTTDTFYHYKDMWRFDCSSLDWESIPLVGDVPSQRSGHRMALWSHYLVLFGGFYVVSREMKYYNDTYLFCLRERRWRRDFRCSAWSSSQLLMCCCVRQHIFCVRRLRGDSRVHQNVVQSAALGHVGTRVQQGRERWA